MAQWVVTVLGENLLLCLTLGPAEVDKLAVESVEHFMWALVSGITLTPHPGTHIAETDKRAD